MVALLLCFLAVAVSSIHAHSWVDIVGRDGGRMWGYRRGATDLELQRYICDKPTLMECQPNPKHNVTYTMDAMLPCRRDDGRNRPSRVTTGDTLYVMWMGNGHANQQSFGQPVEFYITDYTTLPSFTDFKPLASVPYFYCQDGGSLCDRPKTDAELTLPSKIGKYTILWKWPFTDFIFGSCFDVEVLPTGATPPTVAPTSSSTDLSGTPGSADYLQYGCKFDVDCTGIGEEYCKLWQKDPCGRSQCHGSDVILKNCPIGGAVSGPSDCGVGSYCKCWQSPSVCQGTDVPCKCD